jgi:hypothetical protein
MVSMNMPERLRADAQSEPVIHQMNMEQFIMDNDDYPPNMRKPMRDSHFAVTRG